MGAETLLAKRFLEYENRFSLESERGEIIVCAAVMEEHLYRLVHKRLLPSVEKEDEVFDGPYAPLGSFGAKIDFAYRIGVIGESLRSSLHLIRKMRNEAAHSSNSVVFESPSIHSRVRELFRFQADLIEVMRQVCQSKEIPEVRQIVAGADIHSGVEYMVKLLGWRSMFRLLSSLLCAGLSVKHTSVQPLTAVTERGKESGGSPYERD